MEDNPSLIASPGHLYVVATPIGNVADLSRRAEGILKSCDLIACEDTRTSGILLSRLGIRKPLLAYHEHNEAARAEELAAEIAAGRSLALITDAGTPGVSDPGFRLVRACRRCSLPVVPVPGAAALTAVLSASGLPTNGFLFAGFLPPRSAARRTFLERYRDFEFSVVLYESPHRIDKLLAELLEVLGEDRFICLAKEVTKLHETFLVGRAGEVAGRFAGLSHRGEFVLVIAPSGYVL